MFVKPRNSYLICLLSIVLTVALSQASGSEIRTWTAVNGVMIDAEYVKIDWFHMEESWVYLRKRDGKIAKIGLSKLSENDRVYLNWYYLSRTMRERLMEDIPQLVTIAVKKAGESDEAGAKEICDSISTWVKDNEKNLAAFIDKISYQQDKDKDVLLQNAEYVFYDKHIITIFPQSEAAKVIAKNEQNRQEEHKRAMAELETQLAANRLLNAQIAVEEQANRIQQQQAALDARIRQLEIEGRQRRVAEERSNFMQKQAALDDQMRSRLRLSRP